MKFLHPFHTLQGSTRAPSQKKWFRGYTKPPIVAGRSVVFVEQFMGDQGVRGSLQYDNRRYVYSDDRWISLRLKRSVEIPGEFACIVLTGLPRHGYG